MKKIIRLAVVLLCAALAVGCDGPKKADTLAKDIIDQWHLVENPLISNSTEDIIDVYVEFKLDGTFTLYQKDFSTPIYYNVYKGSYVVGEGGIITGKYSDGKNWGATSGYKAEVTKVGEEATLTLTNVDKPEDVSVYEQCTIPSDVKGATVKMTTRGEEMFEIVRFL